MIPEESVNEIRRHGYSRSATFQVALRVQRHVQTIAGRELKDELLTFITNESAPLAANERLPRSSEVLESSLGKLKFFEGDFAKSGFTSLLPAFGTLVGKLISIAEIDSSNARVISDTGQQSMTLPKEANGISTSGQSPSYQADSSIKHLTRLAFVLSTVPLGITGAIKVEASPWVEDNLWALQVMEIGKGSLT